jgi:hypothetical protein
MWGLSMGSLTAFALINGAATTALPVVGFYGTAPVCDMLSVYDAVGAFQSEMHTAYSVANRAALVTAIGSTYNPISVATASYPGIRYVFVSSASDTSVPRSSNATAMITKLTGRPTIDGTHTGNHMDASGFKATGSTDAIVNAFAASR